ncbi:MAG: hypothetical protein WDN46_09270 [Methylocella sp.]
MEQLKAQFVFRSANASRRERTMSKLDSEQRAKLPNRTFGEPGKKAYPMPDKSHAANAKARASQAVKAGRMSKSEERKIDAKADQVIKKAR